MKEKLREELNQMMWVAHQLYERKLVTGSTGNISIFFENQIYVSASGGCLGRLNLDSISVLDKSGHLIRGPKPSKEWPLHLLVYKAFPDRRAVIHTHSTYSVLWGFLEQTNSKDCMPDYTPYLRMRLGKIGMIPFAKPGSEELFKIFESQIAYSDGWLLQYHGAVVPGDDSMDAFYSMEELEETAHIAWELKNRQK